MKGLSSACSHAVSVSARGRQEKCNNMVRAMEVHDQRSADTVSGKQVAYTLCLKKVPSFKLSVTLSVGKHMKFGMKPTLHYPPHLRHVATLPWEITNSNFLQIFSRYRKNANKLHFYRL